MMKTPASAPGTSAPANQLHSLSVQTRELIDLQNETELSNRRALTFFALTLGAALVATMAVVITSSSAEAMQLTASVAARASGAVAIGASLSVLVAAGIATAFGVRHIDRAVPSRNQRRR